MKKRPGLTHFLKKKEIKYQRFGVSVVNPPCKSDKIKGFFINGQTQASFCLFSLFSKNSSLQKKLQTSTGIELRPWEGASTLTT